MFPANRPRVQVENIGSGVKCSPVFLCLVLWQGASCIVFILFIFGVSSLVRWRVVENIFGRKV